MNTLLLLARHEIQTSLRTRAVRGLGVLLLVLVGFCLVAGRADHQKAARERAAARQAMRDFFLSQGATKLHNATHYGTYVFKPTSLLSVVDPGIEKFVGVTLRLEGHVQHEVFDDNLYDREWDALWKVRTTRTDSGWVCEMQLPWATLRYPGGGKSSPADSAGWLVNFNRIVRRQNQISTFRSTRGCSSRPSTSTARPPAWPAGTCVPAADHRQSQLHQTVLRPCKISRLISTPLS